MGKFISLNNLSEFLTKCKTLFYTKPTGGVPKTDLASSVQSSLDLADSAVQAEPVGSVSPVVEPYDYATKAELSQLGQEVDNIVFRPTGNIAASGIWQNFHLSANGLFVANNDANVYRYVVAEGEIIYLKLAKDTEGVYQFQTAQTAPTSGTNTNLVGPTVTVATDAFVTVPQGATRLYVSQLKTNTTNEVKNVKSHSFEEIYNRESTLENGLAELASRKLYGNFVVGSLTNGSLVPSIRFRIASNEILGYDRDIIITANNGYRFSIHYFNDGVFSSDSGWQTSIKITKGKTFKIVIGKYPEDSSITANIDEYLSNIFVTNIYDYVDNAVDAVNDRVGLTFAVADATVPKLDVPTRNGSYGDASNAYAVVWLDIPCAGYNIIRFRVKKQLSATGNVYVFAYSTPTASFWDNIPMNVQYGFYQDSVDKWMELSCAGMQKISIQAYETSLPQQYPTTYTPLRKADFLDGVDGLEYYLLKSVLSQPENMVVEKKRVTTNYGNQGLTVVGNTIVQFVSADDDHSSFANVLRWKKSDFTFISGMAHNLGHAATIDYNEVADALIVANGTTATTVAPRLDIVLNASDKIANGGQLDYNSSDIIHIELKTSAKSISGSGLICCFGGNWREIFLATGQNAPRRIYKCLLGVGNEDFSDTTAEQNDASRWGTFIAGKTNAEYNGTLKIISSYIGEETQTFQGMCYRAGYIYLACGTTRPLIHKIRLYQNGQYNIVQTNLPLDYNPDGSEKTVEPEGLCFYDNGSLLVGMPNYGGLYLIDRF